MIRALATIVAALRFVAPHWHDQLPPREVVAAYLQRLAEDRELDPLTVVASVEIESHWDPTAVGKAGELGLGQVSPLRFEGCRDNPLSSERCLNTKAALLDWRFNLDQVTSQFWTWRGYCEEHVGKSDAKYWLQGYQGYDWSRSQTCGHRRVHHRWVQGEIPRHTRWVLERRAELARRFG